MLIELGRALFASMLTELIVLVIALLLRDDRRKVALVLTLGTIIAGVVGFGPQIVQDVGNNPSPSLSPINVSQGISTYTPTTTAPQIIPSRTPALTVSQVTPIVIVVTRTPVPRPTTVGRGGLGNFSFGMGNLNLQNCTLANAVSTVDQLSLWKQYWLGFAVPYKFEDVGNSIIMTVYAPDGSKVYDQVPIELDNLLCIQYSLHLSRTSTPGTYRLEIAYNGITVFEKNFEVQYYDLSQVPVPNRPAYGNFTFGRGGTERQGCDVDQQTDSINAADFTNDDWIYYTSTYSKSDIGNTYHYQIFNTNDIMTQDWERTLKDDDYFFCQWGGI